MADSEFERFKKMFPRGKEDMKIMAIPSPLPGPGGIVRGMVGKGVQSGIRRFSDVDKGDKTTKMKTRQGTERRDATEPRVVPSGRSEALKKAREGGGGPTKMKDRRGLEIKPQPRKSDRQTSRGMGVAKMGVSADGNTERRTMSNADVQRSSSYMDNPTQRPYDAKTSPERKPVPRPKARPDRKMTEAKKKVSKEPREKARASKPSAPKKKPSFRGNWVGAAPTAMQKRGGARIKGANILDAIRKR